MTGPGWELRLGDWREVLAGARGDVLITDTPYSKRQISGFRSGSQTWRGIKRQPRQDRRCVIPYAPLGEPEAQDLAAWATGGDLWGVAHWAIIFGDHVAWRWHEAAFGAADWFVFAPVIWGKPNPPPRMAGDGPCCACEHLLVARPRRQLPPERRGHRRGLYTTPALVGNSRESLGLTGQKPLDLMREIVLDYTLPGDLVIDPFAGTGTTGAAALLEGRRFLGAELDPATYEIACRRLAGLADG